MVDSLKIEVALDGTEQVKTDFYELGVAGRQAFLGIAKAAAEFSVIIAGIGAAVGGLATRELLKFANAAEETEKALTQLQKVSGASFQNLSALQQVFAAGGTDIKKFASELGNLSEKIAEAGQQAKIRDASKDTVQWANDVSRVREQFNNLAQGVKTTFDPLTKLDTKVHAVLESLAKKPISMIPGVSDVANAEEQFSKLADIFKSLSSDMERAQFGKALGLSPETINTLSQGSAKLKELQAEAQRLGLTLTTGNQTALQQMAQGWNQFTTLLSAFFQKMGALAAPAFAGIVDVAKQAMAGIIADFQNLPRDEAIANLGNRIAPAFSALGQVLLPIVTAAATALGNAFADSVLSSIKSSLTPQTTLWDAILEDFRKFGESIVANAAILGQKVKQAFGLGGGGGAAAGDGASGFAGGGLLGGRGNGTSDSNLAWVSRGEHIMPAAAVAQPGVLSFLEALRRSGGNLSRVLDGMGRFALGGMVPRTMPAFASGGLAGGMSNVTIQFPGLPDIGGLRASASTVDELRRTAALAQVRSGGRKPSRYS